MGCTIERILCGNGDLGVRVFFVLSGFLITFLLLNEARKNDCVSLKKFYARRVLRIFPVYFLYLFTLGVLQFIAGWYHDTPSSWIGSLTFLRNFLGRGDSASAHFWSLAVEEQFYLLWPCGLVALKLWRKTGGAKAMLIAACMLCLLCRACVIPNYQPGMGWWNYLFLPRSFMMYADSLAIGCMGAFFHIEQVSGQRQMRGTNRILFAAIGVLLLTVAGQLFLGIPLWIQPVVPTVQAVAIMVAMLVSVWNMTGPVHRFLNFPVMIWLGGLSYSLYVWHFLFVASYAGAKLAGLPLYHWLVWWLPGFGAAVASYYFWEQPILSLKYRLGLN